MKWKSLCLSMLKTLEQLGYGGRFARIDARYWHRHYARKIKRRNP